MAGGSSSVASSASGLATRIGPTIENDDETRRAATALQGAGYDARVVEVSYARLDDTPGALRAFVQSITAKGLWVEEILVSTPEADGKIIVQIFTSST